MSALLAQITDKGGEMADLCWIPLSVAKRVLKPFLKAPNHWLLHPPAPARCYSSAFPAEPWASSPGQTDPAWSAPTPAPLTSPCPIPVRSSSSRSPPCPRLPARVQPVPNKLATQHPAPRAPAPSSQRNGQISRKRPTGEGEDVANSHPRSTALPGTWHWDLGGREDGTAGAMGADAQCIVKRGAGRAPATAAPVRLQNFFWRDRALSLVPSGSGSSGHGAQ